MAIILMDELLIQANSERANQMTKDEFDQLPLASIYRRAGILPEEVMVHPELGDCLSETAVRKLAGRAPDQDRAEHLL